MSSKNRSFRQIGEVAGNALFITAILLGSPIYIPWCADIIASTVKASDLDLATRIVVTIFMTIGSMAGYLALVGSCFGIGQGIKALTKMLEPR